MEPKKPVPKHSSLQHSISDILDELAAQQRRGETSLVIRIEPDLIQDAMKLPGYRKLFAPVIPGLTEMAPIYAEYERMRQAEQHAILVLVECRTTDEFGEALGRLPIRRSSEWRSFSA